LFLKETTLNITQASGVWTFGLGLGWDNSAPTGKRAKGIFDDSLGSLRGLTPEGRAERAQFYRESVAGRYRNYLNRVATGSVKVTGGVNLQLFEMFGGTETDADSNGFVDNRYALKGWSVTAGVKYTPIERLEASLTGYFSSRRATAEEGQQLVSYPGGSVSLTWRAIDLMSPEDYQLTDQFIESKFIPSITPGVGFEYERCSDGAAVCADSVKYRLAFTPFIDFRITSAAQFRLGVPFVRELRFDDKSASRFTLVAQYNIQLTNPPPQVGR
jgi:hypothetical protein